MNSVPPDKYHMLAVSTFFIDRLQLTPFSSGRSKTQTANQIKGLNTGTPNLVTEIAN